MDTVTKINDNEVASLLTWEKTVEVVKQALIAISNFSSPGGSDGEEKSEDLVASESVRTFTRVPPENGVLLCMPGYMKGLNLGLAGKPTPVASLSCKLITVFGDNPSKRPPLPLLHGVVILFDETNGSLRALIDADQLTQWRTAAVTCAATHALWAPRVSGVQHVLGVLGAGVQGRVHALALHHQFNFHEIRIWNRTTSRSEHLVEELVKMGLPARLVLTAEQCCVGADVIVTATAATATLVQADWIKAGAHINAVGVGRVRELAEGVYKRSTVYVERVASAKKELEGMIVAGEVGAVLAGTLPAPPEGTLSVFQSLGDGTEDAAVARLIYALKMEKEAKVVKK